jgi:hypothetical protein
VTAMSLEYDESQTLVDRTFLEKHFRELQARFPIESSLYEQLRRHNHLKRAGQRELWADCLDQPILDTNREFLNRAFAAVAASIDELMPRMEVPEAAKARARTIYRLRLPPGITLRELLLVDAFATQTHPLEFNQDCVIGDVSRFGALDPSHAFLHRAQQSEFLLLHEVFVGYLVNLSMLGGVVPDSRDALSLTRPDGPGWVSNYWGVTAYVVHRLGELVGRDPKVLAGLHIADGSQIRAELPAVVLDAMTLASLIYWYLDFASSAGRYRLGPGELLGLLVMFFVIPALERVQHDPASRLRDDAGRTVDRTLRVLMSDPELEPGSVNVVDLVRHIVRFADDVWVGGPVQLRIPG